MELISNMYADKHSSVFYSSYPERERKKKKENSMVLLTWLQKGSNLYYEVLYCLY